MKALRNKFWVRMLVQVALLGPLTVATSCAGSKGQQAREPLVAQSDAKTDDEILYAAALDVLAEESLDVELEDPERGMVLTSWTAINREVRHRWVVRVIRSNVGLVLTVDSQYQRRSGSGADESWADAEDDFTLEEKARDEQRMGSAIQTRFKALK